MGQAEEASKTPRYDPHLRRACAEWALKLRNRNYEYHIVPGGGIIDVELDVSKSPIFVSESFKDVDKTSGLFRRQLEVETNKRNFEFNISRCEKIPGQR